jgi:hypothetical protein
MAYNFELSITATVTGKVAEDIVRSVVEEQTGRKIHKIEPKYSRVSKGFGPDVEMYTEFDGYTITFMPEKATAKSKQNVQEFNKETYD